MQGEMEKMRQIKMNRKRIESELSERASTRRSCVK
jgi:hypothetical protein